MFNWSEEQRRVIETRNADILVSAAAGSGKTAVLVERIARLICDEGLSLDELIVMTFTKAAASEMRERVEKALHERLEAEPDNAHIRTQLACMSRARISTIDSICQNLIKQYYQYLDIDPNFRVADSGELKIMQSDIISELLEECYAQADPDFMRLADNFSKKADDSGIAALIKALYGFAESKAAPERFFEELRQESEREADGDFESSEWYAYLDRSIKSDMQAYIELFDTAIDICGEPGGPDKYIEDLTKCQTAAEQIAGAESYRELYETVSSIDFVRIPTVRGADPALKELVKSCRDSFKDYVNKKLKGKLVMFSPEELSTIASGSARINRTVVMLTAEFARRFASAKREANIVDFADAEHFALKLLYEEQDGSMVPSAIADEMAMKLKEVMIDEYQDSNAVQDALLKALSAERFGRPDIFMVGDVKQSIYRFRKAEPKIFTDKYDSFKDSGEHIKIELNSNFRSRREVLYSVNAVFDRIMMREIGGVEYDAAARLNAKASFTDNLALGEDGEAYSLCNTEILIADVTKTDNAADTGTDEEAEELAAKELEFSMIAKHINELVNGQNDVPGFRVQAKDKSLRPAGYGDIAILLRNAKSNAEQLAGILNANGIPADYDRKGGYFETTEVDICLSMLNIIDNPHQDIPLASVMRSPMYGFTDDELALIKARYKAHAEKLAQEKAEAEAELYEAEAASLGNVTGDDIEDTVSYSGKGTSDNGDNSDYGSEASSEADVIDLAALSRDDFWNAVCYAALTDARTAAFTEDISHYRMMSNVMPVHRLLQRIYDETGYYNYVTAMPLGEVRRKNLDKLSRLAESYAATGMQGLYNFIRYVEELINNKSDEGSAADDTGSRDSVHIVTIHGSKGLEYPIVFLARCSDFLSRGGSDESDIMVDNELGIASDYIDAEAGLKYPSLKRAVLKLKSRDEDLGELQRLLYVAMTRAKEKLIITGTKSGSNSKTKTESVAEKVQAISDRGSVLGSFLNGRGKFSKRIVAELNNYLDMMLLAAGNDRKAFNISIYTRNDLIGAAQSQLTEEIDSRLKLEAIRDTFADRDLSTKQPGSEYEEQLTRLFSSKYAYETETKLRPKVSVSEIKLMEQMAENASADESAEGGVYSEEPLLSAAIKAAEPFDADFDADDSSDMENRWLRAVSEENGAAVDMFTDMHGADERREKILNKDTGLADKMAILYGRAGGKDSGASRGTAFHRAMELLDFMLNEEENLQYLAKCGKMTETALKLLDKDAVRDFFRTELAGHMREAAVDGRLKREQHFMIGKPARELIASQDSDELQLLQGIIDAYIEETDGSITLIDYKTDRTASEEELKARYGVQLKLYAEALTQLTSKPVRQKIIYSTFMKRQIML